MPKILLERNCASGCQSAVVDVKEKNCTENTSFFQLSFLGSLKELQMLSGSKVLPGAPQLAPHRWREEKAAAELRMSWPLIVFISTAEVLAKGEGLTHLASQTLQL